MTTIVAFIFWIAAFQTAPTGPVAQAPRLPVRTTVSGTTVRSDASESVTYATLNLVPLDDPGTTPLAGRGGASPSGNLRTTSDALGQLQFSGVLPRRYAISAEREGYLPATQFLPGPRRSMQSIDDNCWNEGRWPHRDDDSGSHHFRHCVWSHGTAPGWSDCTGLSCAIHAVRTPVCYLSPGSTVNGEVDTADGPALDFRVARVALESVDPDLPSPAIAIVDANGQFSVPRVEPGEYVLRTVGLPGDVYVKSIRSGDADRQTDKAPSHPVCITGTHSHGSGLRWRKDGRCGCGQRQSPIRRCGCRAGSRCRSPEFSGPVSGDRIRSRRSLHIAWNSSGRLKLFAWQNIEPNAYLNDVYMTGFEPLGIPMTISSNAAGTTSVRLIPME